MPQNLCKYGEKNERCYIKTAEGPASALESDGAVTRCQLEQAFRTINAQALTENDIELRYRRMATIGSAERGLELLDQLDRSEREQ